MHLGMNGYKKIVKRCMKMTHRLVNGVRESGVTPVIDPVMNIVSLEIPQLDEVRKRLDELAAKEAK